MSNWLAIDTAMNACSVGVTCADGTFFSISEMMQRGQSERLMPMILDVVGQAGLSLSAIDSYAVTTGPGTFTGLRVGLATIRALAQVSGKPALGVSTFDVIERAVGKTPLCILIETKRSDYYVRAPGFTDGCYSADELRDMITPDWIIAGDALDRAQTELHIQNETIPITSLCLESLIACADAGQGVNPPQPIYLRGADVSISRKKSAQIV